MCNIYDMCVLSLGSVKARQIRTCLWVSINEETAPIMSLYHNPHLQITVASRSIIQLNNQPRTIQIIIQLMINTMDNRPRQEYSTIFFVHSYGMATQKKYTSTYLPCCKTIFWIQFLMYLKMGIEIRFATHYSCCHSINAATLVF